MSECCQVGSEAHPGPCPLHDVEWRRLKSCIEEWPECYSGGYDPRCCRFPKSCSCMDSPLLVSEDKLEPIPAAEEPPARLPDASNPEEAIPWIRDNLRDGWTANSDAVRTLLAEYDRMKLDLEHRRAWENYHEDCQRQNDECYLHSIAQAREFLEREDVIASKPNDPTYPGLIAEAKRWIETGIGLTVRDRPLVLEPPKFPDPDRHD